MVKSTDRTFIRAPLAEVWELAADPDRQTEWWPDTIEFECAGESFEQGCKVRNINARPWPMSNLETTVEVETLQPGHELLVRCMDTGTYTRAVLTEAQGGTYVECEAGNDPENLSYRVIDATVGKRLFRRWVEHALDKMKAAAEQA
ncbi:MAG: SRPBCC family protein [Solirubrobacterales bacterium]